MIKAYECMLCKMGWDVDRIVEHYVNGGFRVWEFLPAEGIIYLEAAHPTRRTLLTVAGVYG